MTPKDIHELATIVNRFELQRVTTKAACEAIRTARLHIFTDSIGVYERDILTEARMILENISANSGQSDAEKYFINLQKETTP